MDNLCIEEVDPSVSFLYKAMLQRDPKKRRVKPVQKHMIQVDFGGGDDSDEDSDFDMKKHKGDSADEDSDEKIKPESDDDDDDSGVTDESDEDGESSGDESDHGKSHLSILNMDLDSADDEDYVPNQKKKKLPAIPNKEILMEPLEAATPPPLLDNHDIKIVICCVCLTDVTGDDDEIVECDNCGASVHEGCYGISDFQSTASTESSASTEPWFCDACKAGVTPSCELCPNFGGIFKETDTGKWVHLVCALYTPGVAFGDVDKLSPITLFEMPYARWGARECSLCEDIRFSRTGVCISCDAGMCRSYFHVTCAQREGLLSEASPEEVMDIADPFYAYCKLHADKNTSRHKRRNWLAIQSRVKRLKEKSIDDEREKARFERKLQRHCEKYTVARQKRPPSWVPTQKMVRFLSSSPSAVRNMLRKAELMGVITHVQAAPNQKQESRKKWHTAPAFSTEFITHYLERNVRIDNMKNSLKELMKQNLKLHEQEKILRQKYDQLSQSVEDLKQSNNKMRGEGEGVWQKLVEIGGKNIKLPDLFKPKKTVKPATKNPKETPKSPPPLIHQCGICKKTTNQHQLAKCDSCKLFYHLGCLDPPLTRMPKKTKLMGWQCSECADTSSEEEEVPDHVVDGPRRLRETIKEPLKFQFMEMYDYKKREKKKPRGIKKKKLPKIVNAENESLETETKTPTNVKKRKIGASVRAKKPVTITKKKEVTEEVVECVVCSQPGETSNTVRCDECQLCYHFTCLNPPVKKSPKRRGYSWHCEACDPTDDSEDFGGIEEDEDSKLSAPPLEGSVNSSDDDVIFIEQVDL